MMDPSASTTVKFITQSFMVPYRMALVPLRDLPLAEARCEFCFRLEEPYLQFVDTIPPILAWPQLVIGHSIARFDSTCRWAWVHGKEQTTRLDLLIQIDPGHTRLDHYVHTSRVVSHHKAETKQTYSSS